MFKAIKVLHKNQSSLPKVSAHQLIKKTIKTVEGLGLNVKGVKANPDGSIFVETEKQGVEKNPPSYWDKVLPK